MQIVIDIPEGILNTIQADEMISREQLAVLQMHILNGTPLPKGHGRIIDESKITQTEWEMIEEEFESRLQNTIIHRYRVFKGSNAPTIIDADKESDTE